MFRIKTLSTILFSVVMAFSIANGAYANANGKGKGSGGGGGDGGGDGVGDGHTHLDLQALIDGLRTELLGVIEQNSPEKICSIAMELEPYDESKYVNVDTLVNGSSTGERAAACTDPSYTRVGLLCRSTARDSFLTTAGSDLVKGDLGCRVTAGSSDPNLKVEIASYPICVKAILVCD